MVATAHAPDFESVHLFRHPHRLGMTELRGVKMGRLGKLRTPEIVVNRDIGS